MQISIPFRALEIIFNNNNNNKGVFKGGVQGVQTPPRNFQIFFLKSEGKEIERKRKKVMLGGGGLPLNIFLGLIFFRVGLRYFQGGGGEKLSRG